MHEHTGKDDIQNINTGVTIPLKLFFAGLAAFSFLILVLFVITSNDAQSAVNVFDRRVSASADDAEESSSGSVSLTSSDLELVLEATNQTVGMRFGSMTIPQGAMISNAFIQFTVDEISSVATSLNFYGHNTDNAPTFTTATNNISSRPRTTASVSWTPNAWNTVGAAGADQRTPDLSFLIQEIVNRPSWASGNALAIIVTGSGKRVAEAYNGEPTKAPLLHVEYTSTPDTTAPTVSLTSPADGSTVSGTVTVGATASDDVGVSGVQFTLDGGILGAQDSTAPYSIPWNTTSVTNDSHTLTAVARDAAGNTATSSPVSVTVSNTASSTAITFVGAGDIATSGSNDEATAQLLDQIVAGDPNTVIFTLGDNAYSDGTTSNFTDYYAPTWGRHKIRTKPVAGNHDWHVPNAADYLNYFCASTSDCAFPGGTQQYYYSYDLGNWHIIALDSQLDVSANSAQVSWLTQDLAENPRICTLAYWHKPRFGSSAGRGDSSGTKPLWDVLYAADADVVLNGHDHHYERFDPQDPQGVKDLTKGIREFIVGSGGAGLYNFNSTPSANSVIRQMSWGVLKLTLRDTDYDWDFIGTDGFRDAGSATCVGVSIPPDTTAPTVSLTSPADGSTVSGTITVTATASDDVGVSGVQFTLDGGNLNAEDTTTPYSIPWNTTSVTNGSHILVAVARDAAGNTATSSPISVLVENISDTEPPSVPTGLAATAVSSSQINLTWNASTDNVGVTGYTVYRDGTQTTTTANTSYSDNGLASSTTYSYAVAAYDAAGNSSGQSANVTAQTLPTALATLDVRVNASADDAEESSSGSVNLTSSDLELVTDGSKNQTVGMRFGSMTIPQGATVSNAYIQFQVDETGTAATALTIQGEASNNASVFTTVKRNVSSRPRTQSTVSWAPLAWNTVGAAGPDQRTPNLTSLIQEIVNRPGWTNGNAMVIIITGTGKRTAEAYNGSVAGAPLLHVEFQ